MGSTCWAVFDEGRVVLTHTGVSPAQRQCWKELLAKQVSVCCLFSDSIQLYCNNAAGKLPAGGPGGIQPDVARQVQPHQLWLQTWSTHEGWGSGCGGPSVDLYGDCSSRWVYRVNFLKFCLSGLWTLLRIVGMQHFPFLLQVRVSLTVTHKKSFPHAEKSMTQPSVMLCWLLNVRMSGQPSCRQHCPHPIHPQDRPLFVPHGRKIIPLPLTTPGFSLQIHTLKSGPILWPFCKN